MKQNHRQFANLILLYIFLMLAGIALAQFLGIGSYVFWVVNGVAWILLFWRCYVVQSVYMWGMATAYVAVCCVTLLVGGNYITSDLKSVGMQVNLLFTPMFLMIFDKINRNKVFSKSDIMHLFRFVSNLGTISCLIALVTGAADLQAALSGRIGVYNIQAAGFFHSKNIYGNFVGLTLCADVYLYYNERSAKRAALCFFKYLCVIISFSRSALLQVSIVILLFMWLTRKSFKKEIALLLFLVITALILMYKNQNVQYLLYEQILRLDVGDAGRTIARKNALASVDADVLKSIFGIGYAGINYFNIDIDNTYYYTFFSGGIIKCLFFIMISINSFYHCYKLRKNELALGNLCVAICASYYVFAYFESIAILEIGLLNFMYMLYMFFIPLGYGYEEQTSSQSLSLNSK